MRPEAIMITNKPATPLPWTSSDDTTQQVIGSDGIPITGSTRDAAYIARAANAYPRLVEALLAIGQVLDVGRNRFGRLEASGAKGEALRHLAIRLRTPGAQDAPEQVVQVIRALLRELGEES